MTGRIVEIAGEGRQLSLYRGFMEVRDPENNVTRMALDELLAVVISGRGCSHSSNLLAELANRGLPVVVCGANYRPRAVVLAVEGHHAQSARMQAQASAKLPVKKRLWQQIVQGKIANQASVLDMVGSEGMRLRALASKVRSGDPSNIEAQAARYYWSALFGRGFSRKLDGDGINALLNYGYAVIRACIARAVMAAGLHPTLGLHHSNASNPMCLVDDLMEPYRPFVDCVAHDIAEGGVNSLTPDTKRALASLAVVDTPGPNGVTPLFTGAARFATSLAQVFANNGGKLDMPSPPAPLTLRSIVPNTPCRTH